MATINIPSTCNDPHYRYKMPRVITKVEGRGNSIKTCIVNMGEVARALTRPPQYTTKWLGSELGALSTYTNKEGEGERTLVNGFHEASVIQAFLDEFIDKYVCCRACHLPEIRLVVQSGNVMGECKACGWLGELDNEHKMAAFIVKNPPDESGMNILKSGAGKKLSKEEKRRERVRKQAREESDESSWYSDSDSDGPTSSDSLKDKKEKHEYKEKKEKRKEKEKKEKKEKERKEKKEKKGKLEKERKEKRDEDKQEALARHVKEKKEGRWKKQGQEAEENEVEEEAQEDGEDDLEGQYEEAHMSNSQHGSTPKRLQRDSDVECSNSDSEGTTITLKMPVADSTDEEHAKSETDFEMSWWEESDAENDSCQSTAYNEEETKDAASQQS